MAHKPKIIHLEEGEYILSIVPERCAEQGWTNALVWVYIAQADNTFRTECIQPDERTQEMVTLFNLAELTARELRAAVPTTYADQRKKNNRYA